MKNTPIVILFSTLLLLFSASCGGGGGSSADESTEGDSELTSENSSFPQALLDLFRSCGSAERPLRIMPLGDSITESRSGYSSYRYPLWKMLIGAGCSVDFVGSRRGVSEGFRDSAQVSPKKTDFDQDHEGHWDYRVDEIASRLANWVAKTLPDIVLVHLGTNDIFQGQSNSSSIEELRNVVNILRANNSNVLILIAQVIPSNRSRDKIVDLNSLIPALVTELDSPSSRVVVVDQYTDFFVSSDTFDGIHPDDSGDDKMASRWFNTLMELLLS